MKNWSRTEVISFIGVGVAFLSILVGLITQNPEVRTFLGLNSFSVLKLFVIDESRVPLSGVAIKFKGEELKKEDFIDSTDLNGNIQFKTYSNIVTVSLPENSIYKIDGGLAELKFNPQIYLNSVKEIHLIKKSKQSFTTPIIPPIKIDETFLKIDETLISVLENNLKKQQWKEADKQTVIVMLQAAGLKYGNYLDQNTIKRLRCQDINRIDELWLKYSSNKFGFSVQKRIFQEVGGDLYKFGERVGWRNSQDGLLEHNWLTYNKLNFSLGAPEGHLPSIWLRDPEDKKQLSGGWIAYDLLSPNFSQASNCLK